MTERREYVPPEAQDNPSDYYEEGYHRNNEALIAVTRHGDKTPEGELSALGHKQAQDKGEQREVVGTRAKGYHGPEKRTKQMVDTTTEAIEERGTITETDFRTYVSRERQALHFKPLSKDFLTEWKKQDNPVSWYYENYSDARFDEKSISARELAERTANQIYRHIRMAGRLNDGSRVNLEHASHSPTLDMFVAHAMADEIEQDPIDPEGKNVIDKMGGPFSEAGEFQIRAKTDSDGRLSASFSFRGKEYPVNLKNLKEMAESWRKKESR